MVRVFGSGIRSVVAAMLLTHLARWLMPFQQILWIVFFCNLWANLFMLCFQSSSYIYIYIHTYCNLVT